MYCWIVPSRRAKANSREDQLMDSGEDCRPSVSTESVQVIMSTTLFMPMLTSASCYNGGAFCVHLSRQSLSKQDLTPPLVPLGEIFFDVEFCLR